jgi:hypothetical protein
VAQQERLTTRVDVAASTIGAALGQVAAQLNKWKQQRADITAEVQQLLTHGRQLLADLGHESPETAAARARRGGRPRGYKTSPATRAKLRAAWARRKAAAARHTGATTRAARSKITKG